MLRLEDMDGKVGWARAEVDFLHPFGVEQMLHVQHYEVMCAKAISEKVPLLYQVSAFFVLIVAGTRQQALQMPLARSPAFRLVLQGTLLVNQDGFVTARFRRTAL